MNDLEFDPEYLKTCYQFRIFYKGEEVISTGDDYIYDATEMLIKKETLIDALPKEWEVVVIEWKGKKLLQND